MAIVVPGGGGGGTVTGSTFQSGGTFKALVSMEASAIFDGSVVMESGLDSSGLIAVPSGFFVSGLEASAQIKGTIGNFLATALAGSGLNASGRVAGTSGIFPSGASTTDLEVSTINGAPPGTTTSTFTSGLTTCALLSVGASMIVDGTATFLASATLESGLNASGQVAGTSGVFQSGVDASALAQFGASILASGDANVSQLTVRGAASLAASVAIGSAASILGTLRVSGATTLNSTLEASGLASIGGAIHGGAVSAGAVNASTYTGASGVFQSGVLVSALEGITPPSTLASAGGLAVLSVVLPTGTQTSYVLNVSTGATQMMTLTTSGLLSVLNAQTSTLTITALLSLTGSGVFQSGIDVSALAQFGTSILASGDANVSQLTARGAASLVGLVAIGSAASILGTLRVSGATTAASSLEVSGPLSVGGTIHGGTMSVGALNSSDINAGSITGTSLSITGSIISVASGIETSGVIVIDPPSTAASAGGAYISIAIPTGGQASLVFLVSVGNVGPIVALTTSGRLSISLGGTTGSLVAPYGAIDTLLVSVLLSVGTIQALTLTGSTVTAANASFNTSFTVEGGASIQQSVAIGSTLSVAGNLVVSGQLLARSTMTLTGAATLASTLEVSGLLSVGGAIHAGGLISAGGAINGSNITGLNLSLAGSMINAASGIGTSGVVRISPPSTIPSAANLAVVSILLPTGAQTSYIVNASVGATNVFNLNSSGLLSVLNINTGTLSAANVRATGTLSAGTVNANVLNNPSAFLSNITACGPFFAQNIKFISNGTVSAPSTLYFDYIFVLSNQVSILLPSAVSATGKTLTVIATSGNTSPASQAFSIIAAAGDTIEGVSGISVAAGTPSYAKVILLADGNITDAWYNIGSALQ